MDRKLIPNSLNFTINTKGEVFDEFGNIRKTYKNGDGYITVSIKTTNGRYVTFGVHRLLALTFLQRSENQSEVNHRDNILDNNDIDNLEWVTPSENNIHSEIFRVQNLYPTIICEKDNVKIHLFLNVWQASEITDLSVFQIWDSIKNKCKILNYQFYHRPHAAPLPDNLRKKPTFKRDSDGNHIFKPIKVKNIFTNEIIYFDSLYKAGKHFNVSASHIYVSISINNKIRVLKKKYLIVYAESDFPILTEQQFQKAINHGPRNVMAFNIENKQIYIFNSAKEFIQQQNLSKKAVTTLLVKNKLRIVNGWVFNYLSTENIERMKAFIKGPALIKEIN